MFRRRRGLSPRMRELTSLYGHGGAWPVHVAVSLYSRRDTYFGKVLRDRITRQRHGAATWPPPIT